MVPIGSSCAGWQVVLSRQSEIFNTFIVLKFSVYLKLRGCGFSTASGVEILKYKLSNIGGWVISIRCQNIKQFRI